MDDGKEEACKFVNEDVGMLKLAVHFDLGGQLQVGRGGLPFHHAEKLDRGL